MKIKIISETQTGTTQYVAEIIQSSLQQLGHTVDLHSLRYEGPQPSLEGYDVLIFGAPTYDDGQLERGMKIYITKNKPDLSAYKIAVFGLGDHNYPLFCKAADKLEEWVLQQKGSLVVPLLRVDGFPDNTDPITNWASELSAKLG